MSSNFIKYKSALMMSLPLFDFPLLSEREIFAKIRQF